MKNWTLLFFLVTITWSCDKNDDAKVNVEDLLIGNWELSHSVMGAEHKLSPIGGIKYVFNIDNSFIKSDLASVTWRDEGTWVYKKETVGLNLVYKTYEFPDGVSDTKSNDLIIEKITEKELILKGDFGKTNSLGEFVEFQFIHYSKK